MAKRSFVIIAYCLVGIIAAGFLYVTFSYDSAVSLPLPMVMKNNGFLRWWSEFVFMLLPLGFWCFSQFLFRKEPWRPIYIAGLYLSLFSPLIRFYYLEILSVIYLAESFHPIDVLAVLMFGMDLLILVFCVALPWIPLNVKPRTAWIAGGIVGAVGAAMPIAIICTILILGRNDASISNASPSYALGFEVFTLYPHFAALIVALSLRFKPGLQTNQISR